MPVPRPATRVRARTGARRRAVGTSRQGSRAAAELVAAERCLSTGAEEHAVVLAAKDVTVAVKLATAREDVKRALVTAR